MKCPLCRENISTLAQICPHCRSDLNEYYGDVTGGAEIHPIVPFLIRWGLNTLLIFVIFSVLFFTLGGKSEFWFEFGFWASVILSLIFRGKLPKF